MEALGMDTQPGFVKSPGLPDRYEETPGEATPAWRRALEMGAQLRRPESGPRMN